jgi:CRP-like cAMP-binding protein
MFVVEHTHQALKDTMLEHSLALLPLRIPCLRNFCMSVTCHSPLQNMLLAALPDYEMGRLLTDLKLVQLHVGQVLYESGGKLDNVYFPTDSIVSMLYILENGASAEVGMVGNEGMLGVTLFLGGNTTPNRAVVQRAGWAYKLHAVHVTALITRGGPVRLLLLRYTQALITQMTQTAVCNRHHGIDQRLCRWLLLNLDRIHSDTLYTTQDLIATMLGVRREGVTDIAGKLQKAGYIRYTRGRIKVLDRPGLESRVCECYAVVKLEFERLLSDIGPGDPNGILGMADSQYAKI